MKQIILIILISMFAAGCSEKSETKYGSTFERVAAIKDQVRSPRGVTVKFEKGVTVSADEMAAIDAGLQDTFDRSPCHGYLRALNHNEYTVAILNSQDRDSLGNPAYRLPCAQYCGTEYDKGGYILVAGEMVALGSPYGNIIALPDHNDRYENERLAASFEAEHIVLGWNDGDKFEATKTHGQGQGHPIIENCPIQTKEK